MSPRSVTCNLVKKHAFLQTRRTHHRPVAPSHPTSSEVYHPQICFRNSYIMFMYMICSNLWGLSSNNQQLPDAALKHDFFRLDAVLPNSHVSIIVVASRFPSLRLVKMVKCSPCSVLATSQTSRIVNHVFPHSRVLKVLVCFWYLQVPRSSNYSDYLCPIYPRSMNLKEGAPFD